MVLGKKKAVFLTADESSSIYVETNASHNNRLQEIGRWLFILPFAVFGLLHFGPLEFSLPYIPSYLPFPVFWIYFTGACLIAFTLSAAIKKWDGVASILLGVMLLAFVGMIHIPKAIEGDFLQLIATFRDTGVAGAAFIYATTLAKDLRFTGIKKQLKLKE